MPKLLRLALLALASATGCVSTPAFAQQVVSTIRVAQPSQIVHATVPLPDGYAWSGTGSPFSVVNPDGSNAPTQWERVAWSPKGEVRVAELIAQVQPATSYSVVVRAQRDNVAPRLTAFARQLVGVAPVITIDGVSTATQWRASNDRDGLVGVSRQFYGPHLFGWVSAFNGQEFVTVDLVFHDGEQASPPLFFSALSIEIAAGASVVYGIPEPLSVGNVLVAPRQDGKLNFMEQRGRREFRIAIAAAGHEAEAKAVLLGAGWGVASTWTSVPGFQAQQMVLADLSHLSTQLAPRLRTDWAKIDQAVIAGTSFGIGTIPGLQPGAPNAQGTRVGYRHPFGSKYGGITGGGMIDQWRGMELAECGEPQGLLALQLEHRMITDRQAVGLYGPDGSPVRPEDYVDSTGHPLGGWSLSPVDGRFDAGKDGVFAFASHSAPGVSPGLIPADYNELLSYSPIDYQHAVRRYSSSQCLVWLANDMIARRELILHARLWCGAMWSQHRLDGELAQDTATPGHGTDWGRAAGWNWNNVATAYAIAVPQVRADLAPYIDKALRVYLASQMVNGIWQANSTNKEAQKPPFNSNYATEQTIELGITAHAVMGILGSFPLSPAMASDARVAVIRAGRDGVWRYLWNPAGGLTGGTWQFVAVRPAPFSAAPFATLPAGLNSGSNDTFQVGSTLAYARALSPADPELPVAIKAYTQNAPNALAWFKSQAFNNLSNREPMLLGEQRNPIN